MTEPKKDTSKSLKILFSYVLLPVITFLLGFFLNFIIEVKPYIESSTHNITQIDSALECINRHVEQINEKYTQKDKSGYNCKAGVNTGLSLDQVSVMSDNKYDLNRNDRLIVTYINNLGIEISINCRVAFVEKSNNKKSEAEVFLSDQCMDYLGISKRDRKIIGTFEITFKKII